jgi:hypothetical protein
MTRSWLDGEYKHHRENLLLDRERSLLPATQPAVEHEVECRKRGALMTELGEKQVALHEKINALQAELAELHYLSEEHRTFIRAGPNPTSKEAKERRTFVAACPSSGCRGFLSTAYKCGTCQSRFCASCRELKGEVHECDLALVATIKAITDDSKPCPACGVSISRVSGCDQMYCTQCDTPFSYTTGAIIKGTIHNPHYFERMAAAAANANANTNADGGAGGACPAGRNPWPRAPHESTNNSIRTSYHLRILYQAGRHVQEIVLGEQLRLEEPDNTDLRVKYLLKDLDDKAFRQQLQQRDKKRQFQIELRDPLELFVITTLEFFQGLRPTEETKVTLEAKVGAYRSSIVELVNTPLQTLSERYGRIVPQFDMTPTIRVGECYQAYGYPIKKSKESKETVAAAANPTAE